MEETKNKKRLSIKDSVYIGTVVLLSAGLITTSVFLTIKNKKSSFQSYYDSKVAAYRAENANFSKGQIVFIGDSITDLYHLNDYYSDLDKATYNRGIGGDTTSGVLKRLDVSLYDIEPSKVVLMIGINDINGYIAESEIVSNYTKILDGIKEHLPTTELYSMSILPVNSDLGANYDLKRATNTILSVNAKIKPIVEQHSYQYLDLFSQVQDGENHLKKDLSDDGIHLNHNGFVIWTDLVKPYLQ